MPTITNILHITPLLLALAVPSYAATHKRSAHHAAAAQGHRSTGKSKARGKKHFAPAGMSSERATEIQQALIAKGYLTGSPTGSWDTQSEAAMRKLQGDNGWQTKITPDSRALITLGLGPKNP